MWKTEVDDTAGSVSAQACKAEKQDKICAIEMYIIISSMVYQLYAPPTFLNSLNQ